MRRASLLVLLALACSAVFAAERHAEPIVKQILENVKRIKTAAIDHSATSPEKCAPVRCRTGAHYTTNRRFVAYFTRPV